MISDTCSTMPLHKFMHLVIRYVNAHQFDDICFTCDTVFIKRQSGYGDYEYPFEGTVDELVEFLKREVHNG